MGAMVIQTNVAAMAAYRSAAIGGEKGAKARARLSCGQRIETAADDASGLAISEKMRGQIRCLTKAERNSQDGSSLVQTAEGGMSEISGMLNRMRELTVQALNDGVVTYDDKMKIQGEITALSEEIDALAERTEFNTIRVLSGRGGGYIAPVKDVDRSAVVKQVSVNFSQAINEYLNNDKTAKQFSLALTDANGDPVISEDGRQVVIDFSFKERASGAVDITALHKGRAVGSVTIGLGMTVNGQYIEKPAILCCSSLP